MPLTDTAVKNAKLNQSKVQKLYDSGGLFLEVPKKGNKRWRFKYRYLGKEKLLSLGVYPDVKLKQARKKRDELRSILASGVDPSAHRKAKKAAALESASNSFELIAREWHSKYSSTWSESHCKRILRSIEKDLFPWLGSRPISDLTAVEILKCLRKIENRGAIETAHRALQKCSQIFRYAVATGRVDRDITIDLKGAIAPVRSNHLPAITDPEKAGELLKTIDSYQGSIVVQSALRFAPLVFVRPGELRKAKWKDIDFKAKEWRYLVTKTKTEHIVPLSKQAIEILEELKPVTGRSIYVFPSSKSRERPMSDNAILGALRRLEIPRDEMCGHGFRAMARTILDEVLEFPPHLIEHQLAHAVRDPNGRAYNRTAHLPQRHKMMQVWANYLDKLKSGGQVLSLKIKGSG